MDCSPPLEMLASPAAMAVSQVMLFRDFAEDGRISMDLYADELAASLGQLAGAPQVHQYTPRAALPPCNEAPSVTKMRWSRYVQYPRAAASHQMDINHIVDHGYAHLLWTLDPRKTVITVHDIIPALRWAGKISGVSRGRYPLLHKVSLAMLRRARKLITDSRCTADDLIEHCGCDPQRICVAPLGLGPRFRPAPARRAELRSQLGLPGEATLVLITGDAFYKNHPTCLKVLAALTAGNSEAKPPLKLVRLGSRSQAWKTQLAESGLKDSVLEIERLTHGQVVDLYNAVDCLLFPSLYEGFGWPVLEAMACGLPVVCSDAGALPEVAGRAALFAAPTDVVALAQAVRQCIFDGATRERLVSQGFEQAAKFSWDRHARAVLGVYEEVLSTLRPLSAPVSV